MKNRPSLYLGAAMLAVLAGGSANAQLAPALSVAAATTAQADADPVMSPLLSQPMSQNDVVFITGGISDEDRVSLLKQKSAYNLHITSTDSKGAFKGNAHITIQNGTDGQVISTDAGPLFYAKLPQGKYTVVATSNGQEISRQVEVGIYGDTNVNLRFTN